MAWISDPLAFIEKNIYVLKYVIDLLGSVLLQIAIVNGASHTYKGGDQQVHGDL
jgi:hypothetical protein